MRIGLSPFEIKARDIAGMEDLYTRVLGLVVTDRSPPGAHPIVFLSANPGEHHQLVLASAQAGDFAAGSLEHIAFRIDDLAALRRAHAMLSAEVGAPVETVSHGTAWSVYFRDPEGNRLELFADTPHAAQPLRFPIDQSMPDEDLVAWTERQVADLGGSEPAAKWFVRHRARLGGGPG